MEDDKVTVTERIQFLPDGSSVHVWEFPDGTTETKVFAVSPILFPRSEDGELKFDTAKDRGIVAVTRRAPYSQG